MNSLKYKYIKEMAQNVELTPNGWNEWAKYVLLSIEELTRSQQSLEDKVGNNKDDYVASLTELKVEIVRQFGDFKKDISVIKTKIERRSMMIGALSGAVPGILALIFYLLSNLS